jgi:hypothetical protein
MKAIVAIAGVVLSLAGPVARDIQGAGLDALKTTYETKEREFARASGEVLDALDALLARERDARVKTGIVLLRYALKKNNAWAGRVDSFGLASLDLDPFGAPGRPLIRKTLTRDEKIAVLLRVPLALIRAILANAGTWGLDEALGQCRFSPEAARAREVLKGGEEEFPAQGNDDPDRPFPANDPGQAALARLVEKNQAALRALYDAGAVLKEKIVLLRPAPGPGYSGASLAGFQAKMEELYQVKPEYRTQKGYALEEAETVAAITGLPVDDLCKYQGYFGTMGLRAITFAVPDVQHKPWLDVFFKMNGI